jgi:hypothetical protein
MPLRTSTLRRVVLAAIALAAGGRAWAQLAPSSPFLPAPAKGPAGPTAGAPLEYRGYIETPEGRQFRLYDPARKAGEWIKLNERNQTLDATAKQYDSGNNTLTVEYQGRTLTLAGREPKIVSSGSAPAMPPPMPVAAPMPAAVTQSVVVNPTPAQEQQRLEAVAAEVARRRALREQATQQINQGGPPPGVVPPQAPRSFMLPGPPPRGSPQGPSGQNQPGTQRTR